MYRGETMSGIITDEARNDPDRGFIGGYYMQLLALGLPFYAAFLDPGGWGPDFAARMEAYERVAGMWLVGEDMPQESNRVTLNREVTDQHGLPVPNVHFDDHPNDVAMREHAYQAGESVYSAVDAVKVNRVTPYPSTHNLGTCRMSADPADGVVNEFGRAHDVPNLFVSDGSVFTTGAAANPTLTIVALAIRQAEHMVERDEGGQPCDAVARPHLRARASTSTRRCASTSCWASSAAASSTSGWPSTSTWACPATATSSS